MQNGEFRSMKRSGCGFGAVRKVDIEMMSEIKMRGTEVSVIS